MKRRLRVVFAMLCIWCIAISDAAVPPDYSKLIVGCWLGPRKFDVFHADGAWGIKRGENAPEDTDHKRWHIRGTKLILTFQGDHGPEKIPYTIVSCTSEKLVMDLQGRRQEFIRYSADCQRPNQAMQRTPTRRSPHISHD